MSVAPDRSLTLLRSRLHQAPASFDPAHVKQVIAQLDSSKFSEREKASQELEKLLPDITAILEQSLTAKASAELRRRIEALLSLSRLVKSPESLHEIRAVEVLEYIGTSPALDLLKKLTAGAPEARMTQEAKASLERSRSR